MKAEVVSLNRIVLTPENAMETELLELVGYSQFTDIRANWNTYSTEVLSLVLVLDIQKAMAHRGSSEE